MRDADHCLSGLLASHGTSQGSIGGGWSVVLGGTSQRANHPIKQQTDHFQPEQSE
jgi:hypothetical protein